MTNKEIIRQKAIECNRKREKTCNRMCCTDCSYRHSGCFTIYGYEHGFDDGVKEGRTAEREKIKSMLYESARENGIYASEYIAFIDCAFKQMKGELT